MVEQKPCVFCTSLEIAGRVIVKNSLAWAFPTNIPVVPGHTLICPVRCVATLEDLTDAEVKAIFDLSKEIKKALVKVFQATGFNYAFNEGMLAGQSVPHFHLHVLPRKKGDDGITGYEPRKFLYRPGSREVSPEKELKAIAELMGKAL
jgi:diadenosine tetraphosphate (Ap4A) HIT family hydrolase